MDVYQKIRKLAEQNYHPISNHFVFIGDFKFIFSITLGYILMSIYGPKLMKPRKEVYLKPIIQLYNIFMIVINAYIVEEILVTSYNKHWFCEPATKAISPEAIRLGKALWVYYLTKLVEYCDTLFFILRKKFSHVNFLHVYHHASMSVYLWLVVNFLPTAPSFVPAFGNAIIHVIMYTYYFLAALGPKYTKYLWWKKHLTKLQLIQFVTIMVLTVLSFVNECNRDYYYSHVFLFAYMFSFAVLFARFYLTQYIKGHIICCPSQLPSEKEQKSGELWSFEEKQSMYPGVLKQPNASSLFNWFQDIDITDKKLS